MAKKDQIYIYNGTGLGIPGLPHEVSINQAAAAGLADQLQVAIKMGTYKAAPEPDPELPADPAPEPEVNEEVSK